MKLSKNLGRIATTFLATAMLASVSAVPAFAEDGSKYEPTEGSTITITKHLTKEAKTMTPNVSFEFEVEEATQVEEERNGVPVSDGVDGGVTISSTDDSADFTPGSSLDSSTDLTDTVVFNVNLNAFEGVPGIYKYTITEKDFDYDGIDKDENVLNLYVYIQNDNVNGGVKVAYTELVDPDGGEGSTPQNPKEVKTDEFTNDYDSAGNDLHDLVVYKVLTGNAASMSDTFGFTVKVDGEDGEKYYVEFGTYAVPEGETEPVFTADGTKDPIVITSGTVSSEFRLGNNDAVKIYGLDSDDSYTIEEKDDNTDGYELKINDVDDNDGVTTGTIDSDTAVKYDNNKTVSTPTGVVMNVAPYVLLVVVAAAGCFVFLRKRRED